MSENGNVKIPRWILTIIISSAFGVTWYFITSAKADIEQANALTQKHEVVIPEIQRQLENQAQTFVKFQEKYDRNQEELQRDLKIILRAVKS